MNISGIETDSSGMAVKTQEYGGMAMKKSLLISFAIALVSIAVCCLNMPLRVLAEEMKEDRDIEEYADKTGFSPDTEVAYSSLVSEIETLRGESEKRFLREDGAYEAVVYPYPGHGRI